MDGLRLEAASNNDLGKNRCDNNGGYGFYVDSASDYNHILHNKAKKNAFGSFYDGGGTGNVWNRNRWKKNKGH